MMAEEKDKKRSPKERLEYIKNWQKILDKNYAELKDKRLTAMKYRSADPSIVAIVEGRSKITTTDMQDAIDMAKPDILEQICGLDEPLKLDPDAAQYVDPVKKLQVLGNIMVKRKNPWFRICSDFLDDSMALQFGTIKYGWLDEKKVIKKEHDGLEDLEIAALIQQKPGASVIEDTPAEGEKKRHTIIGYTTTDEYVVLDAVPAERIKFPLDIKDFAQSPIVIEEIRLYEHEFINKYGKDAFEKVKKIKEELEKEKPDAITEERFKAAGGLKSLFDKDTQKYKGYEAYFWEGDTAWITIFLADEILLDEENKYGKPPYRGGSPFLLAHSLMGQGYFDCIKSIQDQNTDYHRKLADIFNQNAYRRYFADIEASGMNIDDYKNNTSMNALVRCNGDLGAIKAEEKIPISADMFEYGELLNRDKDGHIPTPRAYSGIEGAKDERTYRGKQLKVNQASKKLLMMMRGYMEEVFGPLFQDVLDCIAMFMKKQAIVRYLDEDYEINPEDILCKYSLIVNVGLGSHDKQDLIVKLQQLIGLGMQQLEIGIITPQNLFYMNSELVKAMGFLNTMDFVTDPKLKETVMQLIHLVMTMMQHFTDLHQEPEMQQIAEGMMEMIQQVMKALGIKQEPQKGGENSKGTQPGQEPAEIPAQASNQMNPATQITGGGFTA